MLLRHTPKEINERSAVTINPAKTCQPIGAMYAALGIHGCLPHSHGSQGCCAYHRSALTRHYKEPVSAATSSFTAVYLVGSAAVGTIDMSRRRAISRAHTATHMIHKAFREHLGDTATQMGSENAPGRLRFDFPSSSAIARCTTSVPAT